MRVNCIQQNNNQTGFQSAIKIRKSENLHNIYLYNDIIKLTNDFKIPANFKTEEIELPTVSKCILQKLKELNIKFIDNKQESTHRS